MFVNINPYIPSPCVYVISDEHNRIKIGASSCFADRLSSLSTGNADKLTVERVFFVDNKDMFNLEHRLHSLYSKLRIIKDGSVSEWFHDSALKSIRKISCDTFDDIRIKDIYKKEYDDEFREEKLMENSENKRTEFIIDYLKEKIGDLEFQLSNSFVSIKMLHKEISRLNKEIDNYSELVGEFYMMEEYLGEKDMLNDFYNSIGD